MYYILDENGDAIECPDLFKFGKWFEETGNRIVCRDQIGEMIISTVFLGIDHNLAREGPPILWESAICVGGHFDVVGRYSSRDSAIYGHTVLVKNAIVKRYKMDNDGI